MIRTFIAIDLPERVQRALTELEHEFKQTDAPVGWVKPDHIHLTLKFLGNIPEEQVQAIEAALRPIAAAIPPFRLQAKGCGAFPTIKQMRVVWVGLQGENAPLSELQKAVEAAMMPLGHPPEGRPFRPHLTLGRVRGRQHLRLLQEALLAHQAFEAEAFDVTGIILYKSDLRPDGALYTPLFRLALGSGQ